MNETTKPTEPKRLADMTGSEITALAETEDTAHRARQKYLKALSKVTPNNEPLPH